MEPHTAMTGRKSNHQQPRPLTPTDAPPQLQQQQEVATDGANEANHESSAVASSAALEDIKMPAALEDIKMPALDTGMDHWSTDPSTGPKRLALDHETSASAVIQEGGAVATENAMVGMNYVDKNKSSLAKLVKGWETYIAEGARNVQMLQNLNLCGAGEGLARIAGPGDSYGLRHTHSSPLQQSSAMMMTMDNGAPISLSSQIAMDQVRRSSSTPSTSAFRQRSANSAFGVHLRTLPHLNGPDDRSAFSLPIHRSSYAAMSDPGLSYSAFAPVPVAKTAPPPPVDDTEKVAIEVTNVGGTSTEEKEETEETITEEEEKSRNATLGAASRAARFLSDVRFSRRRRRVRGGRENPARPPSDPSPPQESTVTTKVAIVEGDSDHGEDPPSSSELIVPTSSLLDPDYGESKLEVDNTETMNTFTMMPEERVQGTSLLDTTAESEHYHQLDSDIDDECDEYQRIEASIQADSPGTIPSPSYQQIIDDRPNSTDGLRAPTVRIQVSNTVTSPVDHASRHNDLVSSPNPCEMASGESNSLTPQSQDSGRQSRSTHTTNTSGHTTLATSTSATISSGHLSAISETDREVMETNKAAKIRRRTLGSLELLPAVKSDADASVNSSSTSSTNPGYVALVGGSATLREGANVPADRFFKHSQSSSSGDALAAGVATAASQIRTFTMSMSVKGSGGTNNSPTTISSSSLAHTNSSSSSGEDPPTFVSYLDRQGASDLTSLREDVVSTERTRGDGAEERESPSEIVGYSEVIFEEADGLGDDEDSQQLRPIRPIKERLTGRIQKFRYRPPRSPVKGCRPLATPPPTGSSADTVSPVYQHLSPPRNIVENPIDTNLSRPSVVRSGPGPVLVSPDAGSGQRSMLAHTIGVDREEQELFGTQIGYLEDDLNRESRMSEHNMYTGLAGSPRGLGRVHTFEEGSIEIWKTDSKDETTIVNAVSPEKSVGEM